MNLLQLPWLETGDRRRAGRLAVRQPAARPRPRLPLGPGVHRARRSPARSWRGWASTSAIPPEPTRPLERADRASSAGRSSALDELNAPLVPAVALLHFLTALATARTKMRRFSFSWSLAAEAIRLATFSCKEPWVLIGLLAVVDRAALRRAGQPRPADAGVRPAHGAVRRPAGARLGGRRDRRPDAAPTAWWATVPLLAGDPRPLRHRAGALLGDRLVRARLVRDRAAVRGPAERRVRGRPARAADRAGLGLAQHRPRSRWSRPSMPRGWPSSSARRGGSSPTCSSATPRWCWSGWSCTPTCR